MNKILPSFLRPIGEKAPAVNYHECSFPHEANLGSAHSLWWPNGSSESPLVILLFIPGNPGLLDFYTPFLDSIHHKAQTAEKSLAIFAHSHLGHTPDFPAHPNGVGLRSQVASAIEAFDAAKAYGSDTKVVLVGHSVGAWICTQVIKARPTAVAEIFLLFPTVSGINDTPNGRQLSWLFRPPFPKIISKLSIATNALPDWILGYLFYGWPPAQRSVLRSLLRCPRAIECALTMAHDEMNTIKELDVELLRYHQRHINFYFAEKDDWVGEQREVVLSAIDADPGSVKVVHGEKDIPHAFCINHGEQLATQCFQWLLSGVWTG